MTPRRFAAPGRVNLIGEHTDYNDGFVLPMAIDRYTVTALTPRSDRELHVHSAAMGDADFDLDAPFVRSGTWTDYVRGVAGVVSDRTPLPCGANIDITGDVPLGAGLSSSASLELSVTLALCALAGATIDGRDLAAIGRCAEHEYAGIRSGVMDQLVCALGQAGHALLIDCRSLSAEAIALPEHLRVAVCDTGVKHALAASEYNARRESCERGVALLREMGLPIDALRDLSPAEYAAVEGALPEPERRRCRHVVNENARTLEAAQALRNEDAARMGVLMRESHASLRDLYEVSCAELDAVADCANAVAGVYGARMTGGGFGGCVVALCKPGALGALREALTATYYAPRGIPPAVYAVRASDGAHELIER